MIEEEEFQAELRVRLTADSEFSRMEGVAFQTESSAFAVPFSRIKNQTRPRLKKISDIQDTLQYLKESRILGQLPEETLMQLIPLSNKLVFQTGTTILEENGENKHVFILMKGVVSIHSDGEFIVKLRRQGDIFGEMSIITGETSTAAVVADTEVEILKILAKDIGRYNLMDVESLENTFFKISSRTLTEKLAITTQKARQHEIANRQLLETHQKLEKALQTKNSFLAMMSHEIRTPLNAIMGNAELMFYTDPTEKQEKHLKTIYRSSEQLLSIINNILDFSIIEAGELKIEADEFDLKHLILEIGEMFELEADRKKIDLQLEYDDSASFCYISDRARIRQILTNLLSNAIKFTSEGFVKLHLEKTASDETGDHLVIHVMDSGTGIPPEKQQAIFTEFTLADDSTSRRFGGTGLGLTICSRLIRLIGGEIKLESEVNKGSAFRVHLHLKKPESGKNLD